MVESWVGRSEGASSHVAPAWGALREARMVDDSRIKMNSASLLILPVEFPSAVLVMSPRSGVGQSPSRVTAPVAL